jgi:hypothetical protein
MRKMHTGNANFSLYAHRNKSYITQERRVIPPPFTLRPMGTVPSSLGT